MESRHFRHRRRTSVCIFRHIDNVAIVWSVKDWTFDPETGAVFYLGASLGSVTEHRGRWRWSYELGDERDFGFRDSTRACVEAVRDAYMTGGPTRVEATQVLSTSS